MTAQLTPEQLIDVLEAETMGGPLAGRFTRLEPGGQGTFSIVLRSYDLVTRKDVALKFLRPGVDSYRADCFERESQVLERFVGKAQIIQLVSPLDEVTAKFTHSTGFTMPVQLRFFGVSLARETLTEWLWGRAKLKAIYRRLEILREVVRGVGRLHRAGYCHRDLKPDNVLLCARGVVRLSDFGTCRLHSGIDPLLKGSYFFPVGDMNYAAPEMFSGGGNRPELWICSDWFAVGAILFEAVTGQNLYVALGLRSPKEIKVALAAAANLHEFEREVHRTVSAFPLPRTSDFRDATLSILSPRSHANLTWLIRDLCHFDHRKRLVGFQRIINRIDICLSSSKLDHDKHFKLRARH